MCHDSPEEQPRGSVQIYIEKYSCYEELAHVVMDDEKSQDLQSASWRLRSANGAAAVRMPAGWRLRES